MVTMSDGIYRNKNGTMWENALFLEAKAKACGCCCVIVTRPADKLIICKI